MFGKSLIAIFAVIAFGALGGGYLIGNLGDSDNEVVRELSGVVRGISDVRADDTNQVTTTKIAQVAPIATVPKPNVVTGYTKKDLEKLRGTTIKYDSNSVRMRSGELGCKKDDRILQYDKGDKEWKCVAPTKAVFGAVDTRTIKVIGNGTMQCRDNEEMLYWDDDKNHGKGEWRCGAIGDGISVGLTALDDVILGTPTSGELLGYNGTKWVDMDTKTALGGLGAIAPGVGMSVSSSARTTCANDGEVLRFNDSTNSFDCVATTALAITEVDTLQSVTDRGATTTNIITTGGLTTAGAVNTGSLSVAGNTILGDASGDTLTLNASTLSVPNNLDIDSGTLYVDSANNQVGIGTTSPANALDIRETYQGTSGRTLTNKTLTVDIPSSVNSYYTADTTSVITLDNFAYYTRGMVAESNLIDRKGSGSVFYGAISQNNAYVRDSTWWRYMDGLYSRIYFYDTASNESVGALSGDMYFYDDSSSGSAGGTTGSVNVYNTASVTTATAGSFSINQSSTDNMTNAYGVKIGFSGSGSITNAYGLYLSDMSSYGSANSYSIYSLGGKNYFAGNVGIGTTSPTEKLTVSNGSTTGTYTTAGWVHSSDARLKTNIVPIDNALELVDRLEGVTFNWKQNPDGDQQVGFIAQEVAKVLPQVVVGSDEDGYGISYGNITALLTQAVKELDTKVMSLAGGELFGGVEVAELREQMTVLEEQNAQVLDFITAINPETLLYTDADGNLDIAGVLSAEEVQTDKLEATEAQLDKLCVEDVCIGAEQLRKLLQSADIEELIEETQEADEADEAQEVENVEEVVAENELVEGKVDGVGSGEVAQIEDNQGIEESESMSDETEVEPVENEIVVNNEIVEVVDEGVVEVTNEDSEAVSPDVVVDTVDALIE